MKRMGKRAGMAGVIVTLVVLGGLIAMLAIGFGGIPGLLNASMSGSATQTQMKGMREQIESHEVIAFSYQAKNELPVSAEEHVGAAAFSVSCERLASGRVHVTASGGNNDQCDGTRFRLDFGAEENGFLQTLDDLVRRFDLAHENGKVTHVNGLPPYGDTLSVEYAGGEKLYRSSNQARVLTADAADAIYSAFRAFAQENGYDFTTSGSNCVIGDDADEAP